MKPVTRTILIAGAILTISFMLGRNFCPTFGIAFTESRFGIYRMKNRTAMPETSDFDKQITLEKLLEPGADQARWSESRAGRIEGYVVAVSPGPFEAANCFCARDLHIMLAEQRNAPPNKQVVLEVTPRIKGPAMSSELIGHRVRFEGWLFYDSHHANEAENTAPGRVGNWRATAWEVHPITKIEILK